MHGTAFAPDAVARPGPTNQDFVNYFAGYVGIDNNSQFQWDLTGWNANASVGYVTGPNVNPASFLFNDGHFVGGLSDNPFSFSDINDNNLLVVSGSDSGFDSFPAYAGGLIDIYGNRVPIELTPSAMSFLSGPGLVSGHGIIHLVFDRIDNNNSIQASCYMPGPYGCAGTFQFDIASAVPAPPTLILMLAGMVMLRPWRNTRRKNAAAH